MQKRILILDGATGTYLQALQLNEETMGCNDVLCLTQPHLIEKMHRDYMEAGADIITTNSFNCNRFSLSDYGLQDRVYELSRAAAECARRAADSFKVANGKTVIVAGDIGPTNRTASISADVNNPAQREVTFNELYDTYFEQAQGLVEGGADVLLIETIFDTLNAKAAIKAITDLAEKREQEIPILISATLSDASGRTLSGQTIEAFAASVAHANPLSIGLNCGFGAAQLLPWVKRLAETTPYPVSVHPNAGLPNVMGGYDETPETFARTAREFLLQGNHVNIYGGCCGTTPAHIRALKEVLKEVSPRPLFTPKQPAESVLSGLEPLSLTAATGFINVGERTNVAGSAKFKRLIKEKQYDEALSVAREQVENGAQIIDICMDDGLIDGIEAMTTFLNLIASEPEIARVPIMIDSSNWEILCAGLACIQGKSVVNSISLKEGEERFIEKARHIHAMGAAAVVMLFDEEGQADTYQRKVSVARRAYQLLKSIGFPTENIIFDPNVLAVATGMSEHDDYARAFIEACRTIRQEIPEVHLSGGISNLSFSFRGNNAIRQAMHSVFLYHAMQAGLDMSIVNPAMTTIYTDIPADMLQAVEDVILNRDAGAAERLIDFAQRYKEQSENSGAGVTATSATEGWRTASLHQRISHALLKGVTDHIEADTAEALTAEGSALGVIDHYLMPAMEQVGSLFGEGKMFLPQVVKSARVMKQAVAYLEPYMKQPSAENADTASSGPCVVMATVKGDIHDIGKNIVGVVTQCNGYAINDLGVMVDAETIVNTAQQTNAVAIGLSGLITPSLEEMIRVLHELRRRGMTTPVIVGGATTSALHTAVKMAPEYPEGIVIHAHAAADNPSILRRLLSADSTEYLNEIRNQQQLIRDNYLRTESSRRPVLTVEEARRRKHIKLANEVAVPTAAWQVISPTVNYDILIPLIHWQSFFTAWGLKGHFPELLEDSEKGSEARKLYQDAQRMLKEIADKPCLRLQTYAQILPAHSEEDTIVTTDHQGNEYRLPMPRSLHDEPETRCLADYLMPHSSATTDYLCPFVVSAGVGLKEIQEHYRAEGDEYRAILAKLLADRLTETLADQLCNELRDHLHWGISHLRVAFGYNICPDHGLKREVFSLLGIGEETGLSLTDTCMIDPGESICGLIFANTPTSYFTI